MSELINQVEIEGIVCHSAVETRGQWESKNIVLYQKVGDYTNHFAFEMGQKWDGMMPPVDSVCRVKGFVGCRSYEDRNSGETKYFTKIQGLGCDIVELPTKPPEEAPVSAGFTEAPRQPVEPTDIPF